MTSQVRWALTLLRVGAALIMIIHGVARIRLGIVDNFGAAFAQWGFPAGLALAWTITIVEIAGGLLLATGHFVRPLALWFVAQLTAGVYLIHASAGWFVVGAGRNGSEFNALLMLCFIVILMSAPAAYTLRLSTKS